MLLVVNGCRDDSLAVCRALAEKHPSVQVVHSEEGGWGRAVRLPKNFDVALVGLDNRLPLSRWQELGVRRVKGRDLPRRNLQASLILPDGRNGPAYLVYGNFRALLRWNRSSSFAVAVGTLADSY